MVSRSQFLNDSPAPRHVTLVICMGILMGLIHWTAPPTAMAQEIQPKVQLKGSVHEVVSPPSTHLPKASSGGIVGIELTITPTIGYPIVAQVFPGTPAASAGIRPGDVILDVDGRSLKGLDVPSVDRAISDAPGRRVRFRIVSEHRPTPHRVEITVGEPPLAFPW